MGSEMCIRDSYKGRIIYSGDRSLALKLEKEGYDWLINDYKE